MKSFLVIAGLVAVASAQAITIADLAGDFDFANNPGTTNNWSYGYSTLANGGDFSLYNSNQAVTNTYGANTAAGWSSTGSPTGVYPYVAKNVTDWTYAGSVNFAGGTVIMHPGNETFHLFSVSRYTAATNLGFVRFDGMFERLESSGSSSYGVYKNGVLLAGWGGTLSGSGSTFGPSSSMLVLNAGDRLDVIVGPGLDSFSGDVNLVSASISTVPGPAALAPFLMGGLATLRRRRKA